MKRMKNIMAAALMAVLFAGCEEKEMPVPDRFTDEVRLATTRERPGAQQPLLGIRHARHNRDGTYNEGRLSEPLHGIRGEKLHQ